MNMKNEETIILLIHGVYRTLAETITYTVRRNDVMLVKFTQ